MAKHRKFNAQRLFDAFQEHEEELKRLFEGFEVPTPDPFTTEAAREVILDADPEDIDRLVAALHEINDLSTPAGRSCVESAAAYEEIEAPAADVNHQRAACWLYFENPEAFEHAIHLLAVRAVRGTKIALFPGRLAMPVADIDGSVTKIKGILNVELPAKEKSEKFEVRHYLDGDMLVLIVFIERTAEVQMDFAGPEGSLRSTIRRPVNQDVILYNQSTGELEIDAGRPKHREILRSAFATAFFDDDAFFPREESARVLDLAALAASDYALPVRDGHTAKITGIKLKGVDLGQSFTFDLKAGRRDVIAIMRSRGWMQGARALSIEAVRIELVLERTRAGRKVIELSGRNGIKFTRESFADEVYGYLRRWELLIGNELARQTAA